MNDSSNIEPAFLQLRELFDDGRFGKFLVPDYQRGFDWNQGHVDDLWEDIEYYLKKRYRRCQARLLYRINNTKSS